MENLSRLPIHTLMPRFFHESSPAPVSTVRTLHLILAVLNYHQICADTGAHSQLLHLMIFLVFDSSTRVQGLLSIVILRIAVSYLCAIASKECSEVTVVWH